MQPCLSAKVQINDLSECYRCQSLQAQRLRGKKRKSELSYTIACIRTQRPTHSPLLGLTEKQKIRTPWLLRWYCSRVLTCVPRYPRRTYRIPHLGNTVFFRGCKIYDLPPLPEDAATEKIHKQGLPLCRKLESWYKTTGT